MLGRPNKYLDVGVRGRKTGWMPPQNVRVDEDGMQDVNDYFRSDEDEEEDQEYMNNSNSNNSNNITRDDIDHNDQEFIRQRGSTISGTGAGILLNEKENGISGGYDHRFSGAKVFQSRDIDDVPRGRLPVQQPPRADIRRKSTGGARVITPHAGGGGSIKSSTVNFASSPLDSPGGGSRFHSGAGVSHHAYINEAHSSPRYYSEKTSRSLGRQLGVPGSGINAASASSAAAGGKGFDRVLGGGGRLYEQHQLARNQHQQPKPVVDDETAIFGRSSKVMHSPVHSGSGGGGYRGEMDNRMGFDGNDQRDVRYVDEVNGSGGGRRASMSASANAKRKSLPAGVVIGAMAGSPFYDRSAVPLFDDFDDEFDAARMAESSGWVDNRPAYDDDELVTLPNQQQQQQLQLQSQSAARRRSVAVVTSAKGGSRRVSSVQQQQMLPSPRGVFYDEQQRGGGGDVGSSAQRRGGMASGSVSRRTTYSGDDDNWMRRQSQSQQRRRSEYVNEEVGYDFDIGDGGFEQEHERYEEEEEEEIPEIPVSSSASRSRAVSTRQSLVNNSGGGHRKSIAAAATTETADVGEVEDSEEGDVDGKDGPADGDRAAWNEPVELGEKEKGKKVSRKRVARGAAAASKALIFFDEDSIGQRAGKRQKIAPLNYWAGEKIKYKFVASKLDSVMLPEIQQVCKVEIKQEVPRAKAKHHRSKPNSTKHRSGSAEVQEKVAPLDSPYIDVLNHVTGDEEQLRVVCTPEMHDPRVVGSGGYTFQRTFSVGNFCGSGILNLDPGAEKPNKNSGLTAVFFYVISGHIKVHLHKSLFEVGTGTHFVIPRGNQYSLLNMSSTKEARLLFMQARETEIEDVPFATNGDATAPAAEEPTVADVERHNESKTAAAIGGSRKKAKKPAAGSNKKTSSASSASSDSDQEDMNTGSTGAILKKKKKGGNSKTSKADSADLVSAKPAAAAMKSGKRK